MRIIRPIIAILFLCGFVLSLSILARNITVNGKLNSSDSPAIQSSATPLHFNKVLIIVLENHNYQDVIADPYFSSLAMQGANFTDFHGLFHPSYPNYLAMVAGKEIKTFGDQQQQVAGKSIANSLTSAGLTWRSYAEGYPDTSDATKYPKHCFTDDQLGQYVRKHVPFLSFKKIQKKSCENVVPASKIIEDIKNNQLPNYAYYTPDLDDDGHDPVFDPPTGLKKSSVWLKGFLDPILSNDEVMKDLLIVVTYDESENDTPSDVNHIFTLFLGKMVKAGNYSATYNHYSVLRTIEDNFGLKPLGDGDKSATPITGVFQ